MKVSPYWGSTNTRFVAEIYYAPTNFLSTFEIRGYGQSDSQFIKCIKQNANLFICPTTSALQTPASVRINGQYYGQNIITSMIGSLAQYPVLSCSGIIN